MKKILANLNPQQREAVLTTEGPLLVLAGAGSGKTRVVTTRIAHLIHKGVSAKKILAVTFTNKAALEMQERLARLAGPGANDATMCTFHSLGLDILRAERKVLGVGRRFAVLDQGDQIGAVREILKRVSAGRNFDAFALLERISRAKNRFLKPGELGEAKDEYDEMTEVIYPAYLEALEAMSAFDFDDLICVPVRLLEENPEVRDRWRERFRYLHVDEYQDTNPAQLRLTVALAEAHRNLCVVGDDDQAIYGWRGADVRNILEFEKTFPNTTVVKLEENYRSTRSILEAANQVIAKNEIRHPKRLRTQKGPGEPITVAVTPTPEEEASFVLGEIKRLLAEGANPSDIALLFRASNLTRPFEELLRTEQIPYKMSGGSQFYARKEVKDAIAFLKVLVDPYDELALRRIINYPARGIGHATLAAASSLSEKRRMSLGRALESLPGDTGGPAAAKEFLGLLRARRQELREESLLKVANRLFDEIKFREDLASSSSSGEAVQRRWGGVLDLLRSIERYERRNPKPNWAHYFNLLLLRTNGDDAPADEEKTDAITLCTLHAAKGLEFPIVFIVAFEEDILPHARTLNPTALDTVSGDLGEERRLCYVGITRAQKRLYLTRSKTRAQRGAASERTPSRFLSDIDPDLLVIRECEELEQERKARGLEQVRAAMRALFD